LHAALAVNPTIAPGPSFARSRAEQINLIAWPWTGGYSWVQINDAQHQWGGSNITTGDPKTSGTVYLGTNNGRGIIYGASPNWHKSQMLTPLFVYERRKFDR
jgi:hypothetical protein